MTTKTSAQLNRTYPTQISALLHGIMLAREANLLNNVGVENIIFHEFDTDVNEHNNMVITYTVAVIGEPRNRAEIDITHESPNWVVTKVEPD